MTNVLKPRYYNQLGYDMKTKNKGMTRKFLQGLHLGDRSTMFKTMLYNIFTKTKFSNNIVEYLLCPKSLFEYDKAFTSDSVSQKNNYQVYEQLGDLTCNKFIGWYMYTRFPQLKCTEGVKIVARLKINYCGKNFFSKFAESLGFWPFISSSQDQRNSKKKSLLEDVFESFIGVTETLIDDQSPGFGYTETCKILKMVFDNIDISLKYEDLYDPKTRLKELFDYHCETLGELVYEDERISGNSQTKTVVYEVKNAKFATNKNGSVNKSKIIDGDYSIIGHAVSSSKSSSQQQASQYALTLLHSKGINKPELPIYERMNSENNKKRKIIITYQDLVDKWGYDEIQEESNKITKVFDINNLYKTKMSSKYNSNYTSTLLSMFCENRDIEGIQLCLKHGADIHILDSDGMSVFDMLVIGDRDVPFVSKVFSLLKEYNTNNKFIKLEKIVWNHYFIPFYYNSSPEFSFDIPIQVIDSYFNNNYRIKMMNILRYVSIQCRDHIQDFQLKQIEDILFNGTSSDQIDLGKPLEEMIRNNEIPGIVSVMDRIQQSHGLVHMNN